MDAGRLNKVGGRDEECARSMSRRRVLPFYGLHYGGKRRGHWLGEELVRAHICVHRYLPGRAHAQSDRQQNNEALLSPLCC
jgi:hypothetical protein